MKTKRTPDEVLAQIAIQRSFLAASCAAYDAGKKHEALRMATVIYVIVQDGGSSSLLNQAGIKKSTLQFETTADEVDQRNVLRSIPLAHERMGFVDGQPFAEHIPAFSSGFGSVRKLRYHEWWDVEPIYREPQGDKKPFTLTRKQLTFNLRNQQGGAHFDPNPDDDNYERLAKDGLTVPKFLHGQQAVSILLAELACMRQIAWELDGALNRLNL